MSVATGAGHGLEARVAELSARLAERDGAIRRLEGLVERQMDMIGRYDRMASRTTAAMPAVRQLSPEEYGKLVELLDRAIARAEQVTREKERLEKSLDRTIMLLDQALKNQERLAARPTSQPAAAVTDAEGVKSTLARYDAMLERSLAALDAAYRTNSEREREVAERDRQIAERDKLLNRTLDALQAVVDEDQGKPAGRSRFASLFA